jgi:KAP family P-loop domain
VITLDRGVRKADLNTLDEFINSNIGPWRKLAGFFQQSGFAKSASNVANALSFLTIRNQIVCIDDLERCGKGLEVSDVLGLTSFLREQRACKVVLVLNDEQLKAEQKQRFESYLEKVVDVSLTLQPTPSESVAIAIKGTDDLSERIADRCTSLGIANIRVIRRIERYVRAIRPMLQEFEPEVFHAATGSIALFCWSHDQPDEAPTLEFLTTKRAKSVFGLTTEDKELPEKEAAWNALLEAYGYTYTDDFDLALIKGIKDGYFDPGEIKRLGSEGNQKIIASKADGSFEQAWSGYHDSFDDNQDEVLDAIYTSFMRNCRYITPLNLNGTVTLFKDLGRREQALAMIHRYVNHRANETALFDLEDSVFGGDIHDPDVRPAFERQSAEAKAQPGFREMLLALNEDISNEAVLQLAAVPVEKYQKVLKAAQGKELRRILAGALQFDRIVNATPAMRKISRNTKEALKQIGAESPLNARRVRKYGVNVEEEEQPDPLPGLEN